MQFFQSVVEQISILHRLLGNSNHLFKNIYGTLYCSLYFTRSFLVKIESHEVLSLGTLEVNLLPQIDICLLNNLCQMEKPTESLERALMKATKVHTTASLNKLNVFLRQNIS